MRQACGLPHFVFSVSSWLSLERGNAAMAGRAGECALADVVKRGFEEDVLHRALDVLPELLKAARVAFGAGIRMRLVRLDATGLGKLPVHDAQHLAHGNLFRMPGQSIAASHAPPALQDAGLFQLEQDVFEVFQGNAVAPGHFLNRYYDRVFQAEIEHRFRGILAFSADSHRVGKPTKMIGFHRRAAVSTGPGRVPAGGCGPVSEGVRYASKWVCSTTVKPDGGWFVREPPVSPNRLTLVSFAKRVV